MPEYARWLGTSLRRDAEDGVGLVMVLGIMLTGAILTITIASVTLFNSAQTVQTRAVARAFASADAGIDLTLQLLEGKKYNELNQVCSQSFVIDSIPVDVVTEYDVKTAGGGSVTKSCPLTTDIVTRLTVRSSATTANPLRGRDDIVRTASAVLVPTPPQLSLDKAIFSEGSTTITNDSQIIASGELDEHGNPINDAHIYSNGGVTCQTQVNTGGSIYAAHGDLILANNCQVGNTAWASGRVQFDSNATVDGNLYAASSLANWAVDLQNNTSQVTGHVLTNGGIRVNQGKAPSGGINGMAYTSGGQIRMENGAQIGGSAYARTGIHFQNNSRVNYDAFVTNGSMTSDNDNSVGGVARASGSIAGNITASQKFPNAATTVPGVPNPAAVFPAAVGYPSTIQPPPREQMPNITFSADEIALWEGAGWVVETHLNQCNNALNIINNGSWANPRLVFFENCTNPVSLNNATLTLGNDLAIVTNTGIQSSNDLTVRSNNLSVQREMFWIVPGDAPGVTWNPVGGGQTTPSCSPARNLAISKVRIQSVDWMMYTPCTIHWQNGMNNPSDPFRGQMYAGSVVLPNAVQFQMTSVPVPSLVSGDALPTDPADMRLTSRFDVS